MDAPRQTSWPLAVTGNTIARRAVPSCLMPKTGVEGSRRSRAVSASPRRRVARSSLDHLGVTIRSTRPKRWSSVIARPPRGLPLVGGIRCCDFHRKDKASTRSTVCTQAAFTSRTTHSMSTGTLSFFSHLAMAMAFANSRSRANSGASRAIWSYRSEKSAAHLVSMPSPGVSTLRKPVGLRGSTTWRRALRRARPSLRITRSRRSHPP